MKHSVSRIYPVPANNGRKNLEKIPIEYQYTMKRAMLLCILCVNHNASHSPSSKENCLFLQQRIWRTIFVQQIYILGDIMNFANGCSVQNKRITIKRPCPVIEIAG